MHLQRPRYAVPRNAGSNARFTCRSPGVKCWPTGRIVRGLEDLHVARDAGPTTYFEFEVNPNVTLRTFAYNPFRRRAPGTLFDRFVVSAPFTDGIGEATRPGRPGHVWESKVRIPLSLFSADNGKAKGAAWRMDLFRTATSPQMFPNQTTGLESARCGRLSRHALLWPFRIRLE